MNPSLTSLANFLDLNSEELRGEQGVAGKDGKDGKDGRDGINGQNGKDGVDGINGAVGEKGEKGDAGAPGIPGKDGTNHTTPPKWLTIKQGGTIVEKNANSINFIGSNLSLSNGNLNVTGLQFTGVSKISVGTAQPSNPSSGDLWVDTN